MKFQSRFNYNLQRLWSRLFILILGFASLLWFLLRVIPKPSRAFYPCQRAAFPIASGFIIWLLGSLVSVFAYRKARKNMAIRRNFVAFMLLLFSFSIFVASWIFVPNQDAFAINSKNKIIDICPEPINRVSEDTNFAIPLAKVSIVQSERSNVFDLEYEDIEQMIRDAIEAAGGFYDLIEDNQTIVIKPNLVSNLEYSHGYGKRLPELYNGIITDWRVIKAIVTIVREVNPSGKVYVLEGSADGAVTSVIMSQYGYNHTNIPGVTDFVCIDERSGGYREYGSDSLVSVVLPAGKGLYPNNLKPNNSPEFYLNKIYYQADVVISVPLLKNHSSAGITGSVKNVGIGATPNRIYAGATDNHRYTDNTIDHDNLTNLHKFIHDFYLCRPVDYAIMEGLQGTDYGPVSDNPVSFSASQKNMRLILAGRDPIAVDAVASLLMGYDPLKISHLVYLHNDNVGCADPRLIRIMGPDLNTLKINFPNFSATDAKYSDFSPPNVWIHSFEIYDSTLYISFEQNFDIVKVEVLVNGKILGQDALSGFTDLTINIGDYGDTDPEIQLKVYDKYLNCTNLYYVGDTPVGTDEQFRSGSFAIFPNPTSDKFEIELDNSYTGSIEIKIYDVSGKLLKNENAFKDSKSYKYCINIESFVKGTYLVQVNMGLYNTSSLFLKN